jgi:hypothetical protein
MTKRIRRRRRLKKGPIIFLILIFLLIFGCIYGYTHSKKYLFLQGIKKSSDLISKITNNFVEAYIPFFDNEYCNNTDSTFNFNTSELDFDIKFNGDIYLNNSSNYFDLKINSNGKEYSLDMLSKENKLHFKVNDSKYYYTNFNKTILSMDDYNNALDNLVKHFKDNVKKSDLSKKSTTVLIDGNKLNVKKLILHVDKELYDKIINPFYEEIDFDGQLFNDGFDLSIYLYKSIPVQIDLSIDDSNLSFVFYKKYIEFDFVTSNSVSHIKFKDGNIDLLIDGISKGNGKYTDKSFKIDFTDLNNNSIGSVNYSIAKNNNKYINSMSLIFDLSDIDINLISSNEITLSKKVPNINVNNSIIVDNITNQDRETISKLLDTINLIFDF